MKMLRLVFGICAVVGLVFAGKIFAADVADDVKAAKKKCGELISKYQGASANLFEAVLQCETDGAYDGFAASSGLQGLALAGGNGGSDLPGTPGGDITITGFDKPVIVVPVVEPPIEPPIEPPFDPPLPPVQPPVPCGGKIPCENFTSEGDNGRP